MRLLRHALPVLCVLTAGAAALAGALPAQAATTGWRVNQRVHIDFFTAMTAIAALGRSDAWAMGFSQKKNDQATAVIERWQGKNWRRVPLPPGVAATWDKPLPLATMAAHSDRDLWAFNVVAPQYLRRSGTHWSTGTLPALAGASQVFVSVGVDRGPGNVWALGGSATGSSLTPYAARFNGTTWSVAPVPGHGPIVAASVLSARDIWAVTGRALLNPMLTTKRPEVLHWNGSAWHSVKLPSRLPGLPSTIRAVSDHEVWIGGGHPNARGGTGEYVAEFTGKALHVTNLKVRATGSKFHMIRLVSDGRGGMWGLADNLGVSASRVWHRTGTTWHGPMPVRFSKHSSLVSIANVPGTTSMWGVGISGNEGVIAVEGRVP